jgi:hypothetical protein
MPTFDFANLGLNAEYGCNNVICPSYQYKALVGNLTERNAYLCAQIAILTIHCALNETQSPVPVQSNKYFHLKL